MKALGIFCIWRGITLFYALVGLCALSALGQASAAQSPGATPAGQYAEQAQRAMALGHFAEAEQAFEKLRELEPEVAEVYANLGVVYFQERKYEQAIQVLRQALKLNPALQKASTLLAISLSELGHYKEAIPGLEKGFRHSAESDIKRMCGLQLMRSYSGLQLDSKAVEVALALNHLYPDDGEILYHTGRVYGNSAFGAMEKLAQVAPTSIWRHQAAAEAYESQGGYETALVEYRQVLSLDPSRPGIHYRIGRVLLARSHQQTSPQDLAAAQAEFEQEFQLDPSNANAAYEIAEIHRQAGRFEQAQSYFDLALKSYPDFEEAHTGLASVLMSLRKPEDSRAHLQKAVALNPEDDVAWYRLAQVERALGKTSEQQKALAEFGRLRHRFNQQKGVEPIFSPKEVTKQELDLNAAPEAAPQ
jgi:tetratricopeptide (TPR) repeat protein